MKTWPRKIPWYWHSLRWIWTHPLGRSMKQMLKLKRESFHSWYSVCYSYQKSQNNYIFTIQTEAANRVFILNSSAAVTPVDVISLLPFFGRQGWMSFTDCVVSCITGILQAICLVAATSCYQSLFFTAVPNRASSTLLYPFSAVSVVDRVHVRLHVQTWRWQMARREIRGECSPLVELTLKVSGRLGSRRRANTPLQGERGLNILSAWAAEIQLQPNEEWADLPSPSPLSSLLLLPPSSHQAEAHHGL